ncbi:hypothetical protein [Corynebacterium flavescens]|uniref:hypothetical protein n=1 Tax=Corynebacterium flavescens TaxID=28028 RepID=UPI0028970311|nr:hypothetical protein [Corynebacterium flavescens]
MSVDRIAGRELLAAIMAAPHAQASSAMARLQAEDFPLWQHERIFDALQHVSFAEHQEPGSILVQVNAWLLQSGHYQDRDNGLRAEVTALAEVRGHPQLLPTFISSVINTRWREEARAFAEHILERLEGPDSDLIAALGGLGSVREHYHRITPPRHISTPKAA